MNRPTLAHLGPVLSSPPVIGLLILLVLAFLALRLLDHLDSPSKANAVCVAKRSDLQGSNGETPARTRYFATFELDDGRRKELRMPGCAYGLLAEGDRGTLTWRDRKFRKLERYEQHDHPRPRPSREPGYGT